MFLPPTVKKITICELEADCLAQHIMNREQVISGQITANPGIECLWEDERQRRKNKGEATVVEHLLELTRWNVEPTKSHTIFKQILRERVNLFCQDKNLLNKMNSSGL